MGKRLSAIKDGTCFGCGPDNIHGLQVAFSQDGDLASRGLYTVRAEHCGWNDILHGGVTFSLMDEALGWALYFGGVPAVTAKAEVRFHAPVQLGQTLLIRARSVEQRRTLYQVLAEARHNDENGTLVAEVKATMFRIKSPST